jgi:predicted RNase H-like HicB family nuclease
MMHYPIAIESRTDQTAYGVVVPDLPGCFSAGETLEEAIAGAGEAALAWIEAALDAGDPIPPPSSLEAIRAKPEFTGWILSLVTVDPAVLDDTIERVNITLPRRVLRRLDDEARGRRDAIGLYREARHRALRKAGLERRSLEGPVGRKLQ